MRSTNPFDDGGGDEHDENNVVAAPPTIARSTNPFEDDDVGDGGISGGYGGGGIVTDDDDGGGRRGGGGDDGADDVGVDSSDESDEEGDDDDDEKGGGDDVPIEAGWQFLGDLPYRRVTLYERVDWSARGSGGGRRGGGASSAPPELSGGSIGASAGARNDDGETTGGGESSINLGPPASSAIDGDDDEERKWHKQNSGLACYPPSYLRHLARRSAVSTDDPTELRALLRSTTVTKVAGCPHGGPVASVTVPLHQLSGGGGDGGGKSSTPASFGSPGRDRGGGRSRGSGSGSGSSGGGQIMATTTIRVRTSSGLYLADIEFPPADLGTSAGSGGQQQRQYVPADVLCLGFTDRTVLCVVLRDSLCLTYDLQGEPVLPPFHLLPSPSMSGVDGGGGGGKPTELLEAKVFSGGVAVLSAGMVTAVAELLDEHDDVSYAESAPLGTRTIVPSGYAAESMPGGGGGVAGGGGGSSSAAAFFGGAGVDTRRGAPPPPHYALVTTLPTAPHAASNFYGYVTLAVLPRTHAPSGRPEVFLSTTDHSVVVAEVASADPTVGVGFDSGGNTGITDVDCRARIHSPVVSMSFAPNGRFLACFTRDSVLTVVSSSWDTKVLDFDTSEGSTAPPRSLAWCGEDSVVLHWRNLGVLMVGPYGDWLRFPYDDDRTGDLHLLPEVDCCRVVTDESVEILQRVPPSTSELLRIGSIQPGALLLDASDAFETGSPNADEAARAITKTGMLDEAVVSCTDAAVREFDVQTQKRLLRAASYGMHFSYKEAASSTTRAGPSAAAIRFVAAARKLRVLNALRQPSVGFALTSSQYDAVGGSGVVARLVAMGRPALAHEIADYLSLGRTVTSFARASRASKFVASERGRRMTDAAAAEVAIRILNGDTEEGPSSKANKAGGRMPSADANGARGKSGVGIGYATVALAAHRAGRPGVANLLLMLEACVSDKVPALLAVGSYTDAAAVAADAQDDDLVFLALTQFEKACAAALPSDPAKGQANFLNTVVGTFPEEAVSLLRTYYSSTPDSKQAMNLLLRGQQFVEAGTTMARRSILAGRGGRKVAAASIDEVNRERLATLREASRVFGLGKEGAFHKSCTDDYLELLAEQEKLRAAYASADVAPESSSITSTIFSVLRFAGERPREAHRLLADADRLARRFKVPEKRMWHVKVRAFAASGQWANLRNLADAKAKPPIGFKPFALAAIRGRQGVGEIMRYIDRVASPEDRYDLFCEARLWRRALDEALKLKDGRRIMHIRSLCGAPEIQQLCDAMFSRI